MGCWNIFGTLSPLLPLHLWDLPHSAFVTENSIVVHLSLVNNMTVFKGGLGLC